MDDNNRRSVSFGEQIRDQKNYQGADELLQSQSGPTLEMINERCEIIYLYCIYIIYQYISQELFMRKCNF